MKLKITAFLAAWLLIVSTFAYAQQDFKITGKITGAYSKPLEGATIYLKRAADSALIKTELADASGDFVFNNQKSGSYQVTVTMVGYTNYKSDIFRLNADKDLPVINLVQAGTALKEVTISSQKPLLEHKIDRTVVNVDAILTAAGSTALEVLEKAPGVLVDDDGAISLKGKGVTVYIDDKPTYLSGAELESYLRSLTSATIDQIELMTNPPAKYDAAGNGGIINIRTKRSKIKGFNGALNLAYAQGVYARTSNSFNFNYRNNKLNVTGNLSYNTNNGYNDLDINRHFLNSDGSLASNFLQNSFIRRTMRAYSGRVAIDYYASDKTTWGIGLNGLYNPSNRTTLAVSKLSDAHNVPDSTIIANNKDHPLFKNGGVNFNYRHQFDKNGKELTADFDYIRYNSSREQSFDNKSYLPDGMLTSSDLLTGNLPARIDIFAAKTDYTHPLGNGVKLGAGLKTSYTETDNIAKYFDLVNGVTTPDYDKTNHFLYNEQINAGYINASKDFKRISIQAGLRFENTISNGHQLGNIQKPDSVFKRNYNGLFPTLYVQYKLDSVGKQSITLDYGRRIDRPAYQDLNPFLSPIDKFTYYTGNPFLKPTYSNNIELNYTWGNFTLGLDYSKTKDDENETIEIVDGIYYSRPGNLGSVVNKGITLDGGYDITKWFNLHFFGMVRNIHTITDFYTGALNTQGTFFFVRSTTEFKLGHDWTAQIEGSHQSNVTNAQFISFARTRFNTAISKKLSPSTTVKLVVNDIFHQFVNAGQINNLANTRADYRNIADTRFGILSLSYRFGKVIKDQRKHNENASESEQNRVKN